MSSTLTWREAGPYATNSGATTIGCMTDLKALFDSKLADSNFKWQVCSSSLVTTPIYVTLKRKDGSAGRILIIGWTSAPAGNNSNILDSTPSTTAIYMAWFPNGNVDTPSNLTAASGTVMGNDTDCVKCGCLTSNVSSSYATANRVGYIESEEAVIVVMQSNAGATTVTGGAAGMVLVDNNDVAYGGVIGPGTAAAGWSGMAGLAASISWTTSAIAAGSTAACVRTNYGGANRTFFQAWSPSGQWTNQTYGAASDPTVDSATGKVFLLAVPLLPNAGTKTGPVLKLRQLAYGPISTVGWQAINATGPTRVALATNPHSMGAGASTIWATQFKI